MVFHTQYRGHKAGPVLHLGLNGPLLLQVVVPEQLLINVEDLKQAVLVFVNRYLIIKAPEKIPTQTNLRFSLCVVTTIRFTSKGYRADVHRNSPHLEQPVPVV